MKTYRNLPVVLLLFLTALLFVPASARAATITVTSAANSGAGTLRNTIAAAAAGDTIIFAAALNGQTIVLTNGELVLNKNLTILGPGPANLAIRGNASSRVFSINAGVTNLIAGLTITNGNGVGAFLSGRGGGILNRGTLTVSNSTLSGNSASGPSSSYGGGIYNDGTLTVLNSTLSGNSVSGVNASFGGGIFNSGTLTVQNSTLSGNSVSEADASCGGGIYNLGGTVTAQNCTLSGNSASGSFTAGGGIFNSGTVTAQNCTLSGNRAGSFSGGIQASGTERLTNCIVAGNFLGTTPNDIGSDVDSAAFNLIGNAASAGGITHGANGNIVGNAGSGTLAITSILNTNLAFNGGPTRTHAHTHPAALAASPALNAGTNLASLPATDQRGTGFPRIVAGRVDIGAYEAPLMAPSLRCPVNVSVCVQNDTATIALAIPVSAVGNPAPAITCVPPNSGLFTLGTTLIACTATNLLGTDTCSFPVVVRAENLVVTNAANSGPGTLRTAISNACAGATITFAPALNGQTIVLTGGELVIRTNLNILGPGATNLAISGNASSRVFSINPGVICTLAGLTITNGNGAGASLSVNGGGILNQGLLTVSNSTVTGNSANGGGGIFNASGTLTIQNSTLSGNSTPDAGGGGINVAGTVSVSDCTLSGNSALVGGGIFVNSGGTLTVQNSTISGNRGGGSSGGLSPSGTERLTNCIVAGNFVGATPNDIFGTVDSAAYNLIGSATSAGGIAHGVNGNLVGNAGVGTLPITSILNTNLAFNGGPTRTHALAAASLAINAGTNVASLPATDQRGPGFARVQGGRVDIGAFEVQAGPPVITCPPNLTTECTGGLTIVNFTVTASNIFGLVPVTCAPPSGTGFRVGTSNVVCAAKTLEGTNTCNFTVTVLDVSPPVLVGVPGNANYQCLSDVPAPPTVTATDPCGSGLTLTPSLISVTNGLGFCPTIIVRTWTVADASGNSTTNRQTITVNDLTPPMLIGVPNNLTVSCLSDVPPTAVTATDNCDGSLPVAFTAVTNGANPIVITQLWMAQDRCTNSSTAVRRITVSGGSSAVTVTSANDSGPGSLRDAIANICPGGTITFDPALNGQTLVLTSGELVIRTNLNILGPGATNLAISGNASSRVFSISPGVICVLASLTIANGNGVGADWSGAGGGILNMGTLTVSNSTLSGNSAVDAGGIVNITGTLTVRNSTLSGNSAGFKGGGIFNGAGTLTVQSSTLSDNSAGLGGGGILADGNERLTNCIVAGNFVGTTPSDIGGIGDFYTVDSAAYNLIGSTNGVVGIAHGVNGNIVGNAGSGTLPITSILDTNLAFNGGPTRTHALVFGSPARNAGTNVAGLPAYDQRGPGFPRVVEGRVDIGAYELDCGSQGGPPYFGDVNADGLTFLGDFATLRGNFGANGAGRAGGDLDGDSDVDVADYAALRNNFGHASAPCYPIFAPPAGVAYGGYSGLSLRLLLDGAVEIVNLGANPVAIAGYSLYATNGVLNPSDWRSFSALAVTNLTYLTNTLGAGAASFATANPTSQLLSELNLSAAATFPPGFALDLGRPYAGSINVTNDVRFFYVQDGVVREGAVNRAPVAIPDDSRSLRAGDSCVADTSGDKLNFQSFDFDGDPLTYGVTPPGPYPIGGTEGFFWAIDNKGASNGTSILISVVDAAPPRFTNCPSVEIVAVLPPGSNTVQVFYEAGAEDGCSANVTVSCNFPSGSFFPIGETEVGCTAFAPGGTDDCRFVVRVAEPEFSVATLGLPPVSFGAAAWGDYDNDGRLDLVLSGNSTNGLITQIWRNEGNNTFSNINAGLPGLNVSAAAWGDYNNDGRLDLAIAGSLVSGQRVTQIWRNTGNGFVNLNAGITGVDDGALAWGDYDNDGRTDLLLTGVSGGPRVTQIWRNQANNTFSNINANLPGTSTGGAAWGDYNNDGRLDVVLTGFDSGGGRQSVLWRNLGGGVFERASVDLPGVTASAVAWADFDNDGWLDLAIAGNTGPRSIAQVWRNTGGSFTNLNATLPGLAECSVAWGDYDNDGRPDLLLTGTGGTPIGPLAQLWRNAGTTFVNTPSGLSGVRLGRGAWGDYNNDGLLDAVLVGSSVGGARVAQVWRNNVPGAGNAGPTAPSGLAVTATASGVALRWSAAADAQTPSPGLSYNLALGTSAGGMNLLSPEANLADGWRRLPALGNAQLGTNATLELPPGTYFWAVQAIDSAWAGGPFADGGSFVVGNTVEVRITAFERRSLTQFWLRFTGGAGTSYRVEWSEDFVIWNQLGPATEAAPGVFEYLDASASPERRFYRVTKP